MPYQHASNILNKTVLPYVIGVHGLDIPYPAQLISENKPISESGSVVFRLDEQGPFIAEYFAYDWEYPHTRAWLISPDRHALSIRLVATGVELPVSRVSESRKMSTIYTQVAMPSVVGLNCTISGWIGDPTVEMATAVAALDGCAGLPLKFISDKGFVDAGDGYGELRFPSYRESKQTELVKLTAGGWTVSIHAIGDDKRENLNDEPPYSVSIARSDGSAFTLPADSDVLRLLRLLLSFSSEQWVQYSVIYCPGPGPDWDVMNRALIGRLASRGWVRGRDVAIWELAEWPTLFEGLWSYKDSVQMLSALTHLILCGDRIKHGFLNYQDLVDAYGSLEAAVRFWNGLESDYFFRSKGSCSLRAQLRRAVSGFRMGDRRLDPNEVLKTVKQASEYRDKLAHGSAGDFYRPNNDDESERLLAHRQYLYYLARLLTLVKLGGKSGHPASGPFLPKLVSG